MAKNKNSQKLSEKQEKVASGWFVWKTERKENAQPSWLGVEKLKQWFTAVSIYRVRCVGVGETSTQLEWMSLNASSWCEWLKEQLYSLKWSENELTVYTWQNHQP